MEDKTYDNKGHGGARPAPLTLRAGWRPTPFRQFIVKIHSRCDLACDHCYVYATPDQRWRGMWSGRCSMSSPVRAVGSIMAGPLLLPRVPGG